MKRRKTMTDLEKGYIAGLIDGEGSITLLRKSASAKFRYPTVEMTSTTLEMLEKFKEIVGGGTIVKQKVYKESYKQSWCYKLIGDRAINCLIEIVDFLKEPKKKARAQLIINKYKLVTPRNGRYSLKKLQQKLEFEKEFFEI
jgi:ATP-dependent Zn protease